MSGSCPVCGAAVEESGSFSLQVEGRTVRFCGVDCLHVFQQYPDVYLGLEEPTAILVEDSSAT